MAKRPNDSTDPFRARSDEALRWIVRLNSGDATNADRQGFAAWRAADEENDRAAREAEEIWRDSSDLSLDRDGGSLRPGGTPGGPSRRKLLGVAGLIAVGGLGGWQAIGGRSAFADYVTGRGETREATFTDGSEVTLDARSALDAADRRATLLEGQAYFRIARDPSRPFHITAGPLEIATDGAAIDLDFSRPDGGAALSVLSDRVRVSTPKSSPFELAGPSGVLVSGQGVIGPAASIDPAVTTAWRNGKLVAEDRRLDEIAQRLGRYHPGWIVVRDEVAPLRVSVVLDLKAPDASLDALAEALAVKVTRLSPYLTIIGRA